MASSIFGVDHRVEKERDEIGKVVRVKMGEQDVRDPVPVHAGFDQVHQCAWTEIQEHVLISSHQVSSRCSHRMHIGTGAKNSKAHELGSDMVRKHRSVDQGFFELQCGQGWHLVHQTEKGLSSRTS
jgi:hypothetical protein